MHGIDKISKQVLDEAKYYRKCYGDRGLSSEVEGQGG